MTEMPSIASIPSFPHSRLLIRHLIVTADDKLRAFTLLLFSLVLHLTSDASAIKQLRSEKLFAESQIVTSDSALAIPFKDNVSYL